MNKCSICDKEYEKDKKFCNKCKNLLDTIDGSYLVELLNEEEITLEKYKEVRGKIIKKVEQDKQKRKEDFLNKYDID